MTMRIYDYIRDPDEIYRQSFSIVRAESDLEQLPQSLRDIAVRIVHACGMPDVVADIAWGGDPVTAARNALLADGPIITDAQMVAEGIIKSRLPAGNRVVCTLNDARVPMIAKQLSTTRSAAAVDLWDEYLPNSVVVVGNAPTALFRLLERLQEGAPRPAVILGFPVGFVGAAESKQALMDAPLDIPFITVRGRRGGSAMAAGAANALARPSE